MNRRILYTVLQKRAEAAYNPSAEEMQAAMQAANAEGRMPSLPDTPPAPAKPAPKAVKPTKPAMKRK